MPTEITCVGTALDVVLDCAVTLSQPRTRSANHTIENLNIFHITISDDVYSRKKYQTKTRTNTETERECQLVGTANMLSKQRHRPTFANSSGPTIFTLKLRLDEFSLCEQPAKTSWLFAVSFLPIDNPTSREESLVRHC